MFLSLRLCHYGSLQSLEVLQGPCATWTALLCPGLHVLFCIHPILYSTHLAIESGSQQYVLLFPQGSPPGASGLLPVRPTSLEPVTQPADTSSQSFSASAPLFRAFCAVLDLGLCLGAVRQVTSQSLVWRRSFFFWMETEFLGWALISFSFLSFVLWFTFLESSYNFAWVFYINVFCLGWCRGTWLISRHSMVA